MEILVDIDDPVCIITLNRPEKLNALTHPMMSELRDAVDDASTNPSVFGIVITGAGRGFCSGLDSAALAQITSRGADARPAAEPTEEVPGLFTYLLRVPKPVIAAVNGVAAGAGLVLAAMSDLRFASPAGSFVTVFHQRGLIAEHGTSWILPRLLGPGRALDVLWSPRRIEAEEALRIGLVEHLTGADDLLDRATGYVAELARTSSPAAIADTKRLVYSHMGMGYPDALREANEVQWAAIARPDAAEGAQALLEKRTPRFPRL